MQKLWRRLVHHMCREWTSITYPPRLLLVQTRKHSGIRVACIQFITILITMDDRGFLSAPAAWDLYYLPTDRGITFGMGGIASGRQPGSAVPKRRGSNLSGYRLASPEASSRGARISSNRRSGYISIARKNSSKDREVSSSGCLDSGSRRWGVLLIARSSCSGGLGIVSEQSHVYAHDTSETTFYPVVNAQAGQPWTADAIIFQ